MCNFYNTFKTYKHLKRINNDMHPPPHTNLYMFKTCYIHPNSGIVTLESIQTPQFFCTLYCAYSTINFNR